MKPRVLLLMLSLGLGLSSQGAQSSGTVPEITVPSTEDSIDLTLINEVSYDLSRPIFSVRPSLGRGLRDMQNSAGGSACTSCAH